MGRASFGWFWVVSGGFGSFRFLVIRCEWTSSVDLHLFTDASKTLGFGAIYGTHCFSGTWPACVQDGDYSIQWKELFAIYAACHIWGKEWAGKKILFFTDNEAINFVWQNQSSNCKNLMKLMHKIFFVAATYDFTISLKHISGHYNILADMLSRLQMENFRCHPLPPCTRQTSTSSRRTLPHLKREMRTFKRNALAKSTRRVYGVALKKYRRFGKKYFFRQLPLVNQHFVYM